MRCNLQQYYDAHHQGCQSHGTGGHAPSLKLHEIWSVEYWSLRKIVKIVATRCHILRLKCTKFDFAPDPAVGTYSAPHATYSWILVGLLLRGEREGRKRMGEGEEGRGQFATVCPLFNVDRDRRLVCK